MQPTLCSRCHKNVAVVFVTKIEGGQARNEGLCLKCARDLGIKPVDDMMKKMGISEEDLDLISDEMSAAFGQNLPEEEDEVGSQTATFPLLNQLFSGSDRRRDLPEKQNKEREKEAPPKPKTKKHKFLDTYCLNLTGQAREGKLDRVVGRDTETERVIQILNRRQKNNPCLIGEAGVGKTAIAEGIAEQIGRAHV